MVLFVAWQLLLFPTPLNVMSIHSIPRHLPASSTTQTYVWVDQTTEEDGFSKKRASGEWLKHRNLSASRRRHERHTESNAPFLLGSQRHKEASKRYLLILSTPDTLKEKAKLSKPKYAYVVDFRLST